MTVMIGIDPHKRSHTAVALDEHDAVLDEIRVDADARQIVRLLAWAGKWPDRIWAIENANGLGLLLSRHRRWLACTSSGAPGSWLPASGSWSASTNSS